MIRIVIIEDEELAAKRIIRLLGRLDVDVEIIKVLSTIKESVTYIEEALDDIDLLLVDIHLGDGNSFEILDQTMVDKPIIFITAYDQYAVKAFEHMSVSYLLKPIQEEDLNKALEKYEALFLQSADQKLDYKLLLELMKKKGDSFKKRFFVQVGDKMRYLNVEDIAMFYAENKACYVISHSGQRYYVNYTLEKLKLELNELTFHRLNRKVILNINTIEELVPYSKNKLLVKTKVDPGFQNFVSADNIKKLKNWMNR